MNRTWLLSSATLGALWFGACNVYDASILTGDDESDAGAGGTQSSGGNSGSAGSSAGSSGSGEGGTNGSGGSSPDGGGGGEDPSTGGAMTGGTTAGGTSGSSSGGSAGADGKGGTAGDAGASGGGTSGAGTSNGGSAGDGGAGAAGMGVAGGGTGGSASGSGGAGGTGGPIVELTGTATADSEEVTPTAHPASHGNDGVTTTRWCAANGNTGHYWTVDLGAVHPLSRIEVMWEYPTRAVGLPYGYVVSVSNDGVAFTTSIDRSTNTDTMQIQSSDFPPSTSGRHVRVTAVSLPTGAWASFFEARVFGQ